MATRLEQIQQMLAADPGDAELRYFLAMENLSLGNEAQAETLLRQLTTDSTYVPAFLQAGQLLARTGKVGEACEILRKGITTAQSQRNSHAEGEMQGLLSSLE